MDLKRVAGIAIVTLSSVLHGIAAPEQAKTTFSGDHVEISVPAPPIHDYYARLAKLSADPAEPNLPIDAQRYPTSKELVKEILSHLPFYINVPLDTFEISPPPANSSAQTRAELDYLLRLQEQRTLIEIAFNLDFQNWGYVVTAKPADRDFMELRANFFRVGRSMGTWFNANKLPKTAELVTRVWQDTRFYMWSLKDRYSRMRPYQLDPKIKNLQETDWPAYPSGHASFAYMLGYLYSAISPPTNPSLCTTPISLRIRVRSSACISLATAKRDALSLKNLSACCSKTSDLARTLKWFETSGRRCPASTLEVTARRAPIPYGFILRHRSMN